MKTKIIFPSIILLLLSTAVFAQKESASTVVQSFYQFHGAASKTFNKSAIDARKKWFTRELYDLFRGELEREKEFLKKNPTEKPFFGDGLSFEPLEECSVGKDSFPNIYRVQSADVSGGEATVDVKFYEPQKCGGEMIATYRVKLVKSENKWLIADWVYEDGKTLTGELRRKDY